MQAFTCTIVLRDVLHMQLIHTRVCPGCVGRIRVLHMLCISSDRCTCKYTRAETCLACVCPRPGFHIALQHSLHSCTSCLQPPAIDRWYELLGVTHVVIWAQLPMLQAGAFTTVPP
jgi:hypothetical protein